MTEIVEAKDLTPDEEHERATRVFELDRDIRDGMRKGREAVWQVARAVYEFSEQAGWSALGYETLSDWLADPDIGMTRATYHRYAKAWRELHVLRRVDKEELQEIDISKVEVVLPALQSGKARLRTILDDTKVLGWRDLRETYTKPKPPAPEPEEDEQVFPEVHNELTEIESHGEVTVEGEVVASGNSTGVRGVTDQVGGEVEYRNGRAAITILPDAVEHAAMRARAALAMPERTGPSRRLDLQAVKGVRKALEDLLAAIEA